MTLKNRVQNLPQELQANLHQIVENRLIEIGAMQDPYDLSDEQRQKLDQQLTEPEEEAPAADGQEDFNAQLRTEWEEENPGKSYDDYIKDVEEKDKKFETIVAQVAASANEDELFDVYEITQQAVGNEEENYGSSMELTREEWDKMNARFSDN